jgi:hypothetical protein
MKTEKKKHLVIGLLAAMLVGCNDQLSKQQAEQLQQAMIEEAQAEKAVYEFPKHHDLLYDNLFIYNELIRKWREAQDKVARLKVRAVGAGPEKEGSDK